MGLRVMSGCTARWGLGLQAAWALSLREVGTRQAQQMGVLIRGYRVAFGDCTFTAVQAFSCPEGWGPCLGPAPEGGEKGRARCASHPRVYLPLLAFASAHTWACRKPSQPWSPGASCNMQTASGRCNPGRVGSQRVPSTRHSLAWSASPLWPQAQHCQKWEASFTHGPGSRRALKQASGCFFKATLSWAHLPKDSCYIHHPHQQGRDE